MNISCLKRQVALGDHYEYIKLCYQAILSSVENRSLFLSIEQIR